MPGRKRRQLDDDTTSTDNDDPNVVKISKRTGNLTIKRPVRANAIAARAKIKKGVEEGKYSESESDSSDETLSSFSNSEETIVKEPAGVSATQMKDNEALQFELSTSDYSNYCSRLAAISKWRADAQRESDVWKAERETQRLNLLSSGDILSGWVMPKSGQPLPQQIKSNSDSNNKSKKPATTFAKASAAWNAHKESDPKLAQELSDHGKSAQAYLPNQAFHNRANDMKAAREESAYAMHKKIQATKGLS